MSPSSCVRCSGPSTHTVYPQRHLCEPCGDAFDAELAVRLEARRQARQAERTPKPVEAPMPLFVPGRAAHPLHVRWSWGPGPAAGIGPARDVWGLREVEDAYHGGLVLHRQRQLDRRGGKLYWIGGEAAVYTTYAALVAELQRRGL